MKNVDYRAAVRFALKASIKLQKDIPKAFLEKPDHRFFYKYLASRLGIHPSTLSTAFGKLGRRIYEILGASGRLKGQLARNAREWRLLREMRNYSGAR